MADPTNDATQASASGEDSQPDTLGATAGIGYVLGGGLPKGSPALAIGLTTRMAAGWLLRELGGSAVAQAAGEDQ